ncbi:uncharacterized protein LOC6729634 isoform X4 [Drosophila simulans]|uniref:uncharacterized protein LOC6729634 isoform X4 n=1 Tax=Drosophila simulans TaxID=7240 RepID=UPI00078AE902|nr:uncharacterized protein LOC6729634 isoform X4 [Drosophila simulans]KMZ05881.1 uncharacterized protein Dsimw501_GD18188, isoform D [Drosophila simulans]
MMILVCFQRKPSCIIGGGLQGYFNMLNPVQDYYLGSIPQAVPIIAISLLSLTAEVIAWLVIALTRHDVSYTANSAHYECLETRSSLYYPAKYLKFMRFNQKCEVPQGLIQANQGDTAGPSFDDKKKK